MRDIYNAKIEKQIIDRICNDDIFMGVHMSTLLTDHIPKLIISFNTIEHSVELLIKQHEDTKESRKQFHFQTAKIIYIIKFILQLEDEGLITTGYFKHGRVREGLWITQETNEEYNKDKSNYAHWSFPDLRIQKFIFQYVDLTIIPTSNLLGFKNRGYRTKEDKRHDDTVIISYVGIALALIIGLLGFYQNPSEIKFSSEQVDVIINELNRNHFCDSISSKQKDDTMIKEIQQPQATDSLFKNK